MTSWGVRATPTWVLVIIAAVSVATAGIAERRRSGMAGDTRVQEQNAIVLMTRGIGAIAAARQHRGGFTPDDYMRTGLIGLRESPITTSVGVLAAKRTATDPRWAAVMVRLFREAGARSGDTIAAGFSGSFPGLNLATLAAAEALDLHLLGVTAVGASNWGANDPDFTWLEMEDALRSTGFAVRSLAASIGGAGDAGTDLLPEGIQLIRIAIQRGGMTEIESMSLQTSVQRRMQVYEQAAAGALIKVFVSVGGAQANLGRCEQAFFLHPGVYRTLPPCPASDRGVAHLFADRGVPVINLLNVRALAIAYGLPIDPRRLPTPGESLIFTVNRDYVPAVLFAGWVMVLGAVVWAVRRGRLPGSDQ